MQPQDIQNILRFLARVDLKGSEASEMARLQATLIKMGQSMTQSETKEPPPFPEPK